MDSHPPTTADYAYNAAQDAISAIAALERRVAALEAVSVAQPGPDLPLGWYPVVLRGRRGPEMARRMRSENGTVAAELGPFFWLIPTKHGDDVVRGDTWLQWIGTRQDVPESIGG